MSVPAILAPLLLLWIAAVALGWGDVLLRRLAPAIGGLQRFCIAILLGLGLLGYGLLALGWLGWTRPIAYCALMVLSLPAVWMRVPFNWYQTLRQLPATYKTVRSQLTRFDFYLLVPLLVFFAAHFLLAFSPLIGWDAATHHYVVPKLYLQAGRVVPTPEILFGNYPGLAQNLYAWAFALQGEALAGLMSWLWAVLLATLLYSFGRTLHSRTAGLVAAIAFFTCPTIYWIATTGYIDLLVAAYVAAGVVAYCHFLTSGHRGVPVLAAIALGLALGTKHLGWVYLFAVLAGRLWVQLAGGFERPTWRRAVGEVAGVIGIALLLGLPWYLRSYLNSGNPLDPFLPGLFDPNYVPTHEISVRSWSVPTWKRGPWRVITFPWRITTDFQFINGWVNALSPIYLALLPMALFLKDARFRQPIGFLLVPFLTYMWISLILIPTNTRYGLPMLIMASWLVGIVVAQLALRPLWRQKLLPIALGIPIIAMGLLLAWRVKVALPAVLGLVPREELVQTYPGIKALEWANEHLPDDSLIVSTDRRTYFLDHPFVCASPGGESHLAPPWTYANANEVLDGWRKLGATHLIVNSRHEWMPAGYYLYELLHRVEEDGLVIQTAEDAAEWSRGYLTPEQAWVYAEISKVELLPDADGKGNPAAVVRPEWIKPVIFGDRIPQMQGHLEALKPLLELLYEHEGVGVYKIRWDLADAGVKPDITKNLRYLMQGIPIPEETVAKGRARYESLKPRLIQPK